jgi:hypothetical protein
MTITDVRLDRSSITFSLTGEMSLGSGAVLSLLIRRSRRMGLSVKLDVSGITDVDPELDKYLSGWRAEGVTLSGAGHLTLNRNHTGAGPDTSRSR